MSSQPRIAIVGGGPAGLTLGVLLHKHGLQFTIFELRQKFTEDELAKPSGMLDLREESGLAAIKECGLYEDFIPVTGECSEDFIVAERNGKILFAVTGDRSRPEISRNNLTRLLLGQIPEESIRWEHRLRVATRLSTTGGIETELDFGSHGKHTFDLVIGADGAWSKVRPLLTDARPVYSGTLNITMTIKNISDRYPHLVNLVGSGSFSSLGNKHVVISQRGPIDSARIYLWLTHRDEHFPINSGLADKPAASATHMLLIDDKLLGTFGAAIKDLVATACAEESMDNPNANLDIRALYTLPHGSSWEHKSGVTLVGDAAHLMLPNGEGVNLAMLDSLLLSNAIFEAYDKAKTSSVSFQSVFDVLLRGFEDGLVQRAREAGNDTDIMVGKMFGTEDAAHEFSSFLQGMGQ
jgi:2-polyprenyl-6-methoxyphenol hydroxylase-like FAD-dependent oxidoreductase